MADADKTEETPEDTTKALLLRLEASDDPLSSKVFRTTLEKKLAPISITDLLMQGYATQDVPLALRVTYRTVTEGHQLFALRLLGELVMGENQLYGNNLGELVNVAMGISAFDGATFEADLKPDEADYENYKTVVTARLKYLNTRPRPWVDQLKINQVWFVDRVRLALAKTSLEDLGNG